MKPNITCCTLLTVAMNRLALFTRYYLFEKHAVTDDSGGHRWGWLRYSDYTSAVTLPSWLADPRVDHVTPLSWNASVYDYIADEGHKNIGSWIDKAAQGAGR